MSLLTKKLLFKTCKKKIFPSKVLLTNNLSTKDYWKNNSILMILKKFNINKHLFVILKCSVTQYKKLNKFDHNSNTQDVNPK